MRTRGVLTLIAALVAAGALAHAAPGMPEIPPGARPTGATASAPSAANSAPHSGASALELLATMKVKGKAPSLPDARRAFGQRYADTNHDGCDTRNQALQRDLHAVTIKPGTHGCVLASGVLDDPYSGQAGIVYRAKARSPIDFEHVVSLGNAAQTGAMDLTPKQREQLANDPMNVLMVSARHNRSKRDADASGWLPPRKEYRCQYVARQLAVKSRYRLWVTPAERAAMARVLGKCPSQPLPTDLEVAFPALKH